MTVLLREGGIASRHAPNIATEHANANASDATNLRLRFGAVKFPWSMT
ncbi:MAG TPA: hypothetical protein VJ717_16170 [Gemmatimonadaceae bacterium]|nr:hypothetical protein [Gemmatimonadaceae bacterium]